MSPVLPPVLHRLNADCPTSSAACGWAQANAPSLLGLRLWLQMAANLRQQPAPTTRGVPTCRLSPPPYHQPWSLSGPWVNWCRERDRTSQPSPERQFSMWCCLTRDPLNSTKYEPLLKALWVSFHMWARKVGGCGIAAATERPKITSMVSTILKTHSLIPWSKYIQCLMPKKK